MKFEVTSLRFKVENPINGQFQLSQAGSKHRL